jgi:hypothetical protein
MTPFQNAAVAAVFDQYPPSIRKKMLALRELVFAVAAATEGVGRIEETLKWGEPAYVTAESKIGSTVRMDWKPSSPAHYSLYFHCQTTLVENFRTMFPDDFHCIGNREIRFHEDDTVPQDALAFCVGMSLTYHRDKKHAALKQSGKAKAQASRCD